MRYLGQKAPSAKRCIKTERLIPLHARRWYSVRKHRAPKGALRPASPTRHRRCRRSVRKHRAPKGALRLWIVEHTKNEEAKVRKHRAPKGALRPVVSLTIRLGNTVRQKAPSAKRCIKTHVPGRAYQLATGRSESTERQKVH